MAQLIPVPCILMRGGTSRGPFFLADDLPRDPAARDRALLDIMGAGHPLQVDGIGGGNPLTSKVAIISRSTRPGVDVDYLFAQVSVTERMVDTKPNCGNMLSAVGPFAIERGLVPVRGEETAVRIHNVNTAKDIEAVIQTPGGRVRYDGDCRISGVPGTAAPILLGFLDAAGSKTGALLPTGHVREMIDGVEVSCVDMAMPVVFMQAAALGVTGAESPAELDANTALMARMEAIRLQAGERMGLGDVSKSVIPKLTLVAPPRAGGTMLARYFMPWSCHTAFATTGGICAATAAALPGSVVHQVAPLPEGRVVDALIEHPSGVITVGIVREADGAIRYASTLRTARKLFAGEVFYEDHGAPAEMAMVA
jgi:2-methylaconitate cis-trans-isomerase PrpF